MRKLKMKLLKWIVKDLFCGLTEEDVFKFYGKKLHVNGEAMSEEARLVYRDNALKIVHNPLWAELIKQIQVASNRRLYEKGEGTDDMFFARAMTYNIALLEKYLNLLVKIK